MEKNIVYLVCFAIISTFSLTFAGDDRETSYTRHIDERIYQCQLKAGRSSSRSPCMQACAKKAARQVSFYQSNREELIQEMLRQGIDSRPAKINYFLIQAYARHDH